MIAPVVQAEQTVWTGTVNDPDDDAAADDDEDEHNDTHGYD